MTTKILSFQMQEQKAQNWCWAAVAVSTARFYDPGFAVSQCQLATAQLGQPAGSCCQQPVPRSCDKRSTLQDALARVGHLLGTAGGPGAFSEAVDQIDADRPMPVRIEWSDSNGHFVVVSGYESGGEFVTVHDPRDGGPSTVQFDELIRNYEGAGVVTDRFFTR
ncbi:MAG: papain-like cysteine protease family protein [Vicinamibacteria bacterium]